MKIHRKKQVLSLLLIAVFAYYVSRHSVQLMLIQGESMYPAYHHLQLVILDKTGREFKTGDVVAFACSIANAWMVKRIVAGPGDTIWIAKGALYVNGTRANKASEYIAYAGIAKNPLTLPKDTYFMMGDHYEHSKDSRYEEIGCVTLDQIAGRVLPNRSCQYSRK